MAKKSVIERGKKRERLYQQYSLKRQELKKKIGDLSLSDEELQSAQDELNSLPRNSSPVRRKRRCSLTGRPRAFMRRFRLSRLAFRDLASNGEITGVFKVSW